MIVDPSVIPIVAGVFAGTMLASLSALFRVVSVINLSSLSVSQEDSQNNLSAL